MLIDFFSLLDTKASEKLTAIINKKQLCKDMRRLSTFVQTSSLEAFHSLIIQFAPKLTAFSYHGMQSRFQFLVNGILLL